MQGAAGVRGQDFQRAAANSDIINRFNMFNTQARNAAAQQNLAARQGISNANVDQGNKSLDRRNANRQQGYTNAMGKAMGRGNALQGMSNAAGQSQTAGMQAQKQGWDESKDLIAGIAGLFSEEEK
jgi:hypothetical protein